jgi:hypothetical protein
LGAVLLGGRAHRQPREQLQRVTGKDGVTFFAVQLRACLDLLAANDGLISAKIRIVGAEKRTSGSLRAAFELSLAAPNAAMNCLVSNMRLSLSMDAFLIASRRVWHALGRLPNSGDGIL